jgi:hypothetical protein
MTSIHSAQVAQTIISQLGGQQFRMMVGARNLVHSLGADDEISDLTFKIMRNGKRVTHVRIALKANDTYRVSFLKWDSRNMQFTTVSSSEDVYADNLREVFRTGTELETSLAA